MNEKTALTLKTDEKGLVITKNLEEQRMHAEVLISSGMLPKAYTKSSQVIVAFQYATELGLPRGVVSLRQIAVINGTPAIYGDLPLSIVYKSGKLAAIEEFLFNRKYEKICFDNKNLDTAVYGSCTRVKREGDTEFHEAIFTLDDAKKANLGNVWNKFPKDMLKYRSRSRALKDRFPEILNGIAIAEFDYHVMPTAESGKLKVDYKAPIESELNERFEEETAPENIETVEPIEDIKDIEYIKCDDVQIEELESLKNEEKKPDLVEDDFSAIEREMEKESKQRKIDELAESEKREKRNKQIEATKESQRTKSNVDLSKVSPEIRKKVEKTQENHVNDAENSMKDYVIPTGTHEGKKLGDIDKATLSEYLKVLRSHIAKNPNGTEARGIYRAISKYLA